MFKDDKYIDMIVKGEERMLEFLHGKGDLHLKQLPESRNLEGVNMTKYFETLGWTAMQLDDLWIYIDPRHPAGTGYRVYKYGDRDRIFIHDTTSNLQHIQLLTLPRDVDPEVAPATYILRGVMWFCTKNEWWDDSASPYCKLLKPYIDLESDLYRMMNSPIKNRRIQ